MTCSTFAERSSLPPLLVVALVTVLSVWPRAADADMCKPDGQACRTNQSCCGGVCINTAPLGKRPRGTCCTPISCAAVGANCGLINDGTCPDTLFCGDCTAPEVCGGGGTPNVCVMTTTTTTTSTSTTTTTRLCALVGQSCGDTTPCCTGLVCDSPAAGGACAPGELDCVCFALVP